MQAAGAGVGKVPAVAAAPPKAAAGKNKSSEKKEEKKKKDASSKKEEEEGAEEKGAEDDDASRLPPFTSATVELPAGPVRPKRTTKPSGWMQEDKKVRDLYDNS